MVDRARLYRALLRHDLSAFVQKTFTTLEPGITYLHNWHVDHVCWQLARVANGEIRRLIITMPPRSGKSLMTSVAFPAWALGHNPTLRILAVSYGEEFARKLSLDTRRVMTEPWYQALFPGLNLTPRHQRVMELSTTQQGYRYAAGVGGAILGRGADLIVIDDPIKPIDVSSEAERRLVNEFYDTTLFTRLNNKQTGAIVVVMQRLHEQDLVGHLLERDDWVVVNLPAIAIEDAAYQLRSDPPRFHHRHVGDLLHEAREPRSVLEQIKRAQGSLIYEAQYQQQPVPPGGNRIRREWICFYDDPPSEYDRVIASLDTASTISERSDWSVGTVWGLRGLYFYLLDVRRLRAEVPDLRRAIVALSQKWDVDQTLIEETELGRAIRQDLRLTGEMSPVPRRPERDKITRLEQQSARFEARQVHLPREAPWLAEYLNEILAFPNGAHDDQVDSTSQALRYLTERTFRSGPIKRQDKVRKDVVRR